jgi:hypothetical protein
MINALFMSMTGVLQRKMIEWREREHGDDDQAALQDVNTVRALMRCGLLKYFMTQCMRKQTALLNLIVGMWNVDDQAFHVGPHVLRLELEDIYFLTGLSKRGAPLILSSPRPSEYSTEDYVDTFCREGTRKVSGKIPIKNVEDRCLQSILYTICKLSGSTGSHVALKSQMALGIECLEPKIFNWSSAVLVNLKDQLSRCRNGKQKLFGYGSILVSFFLERVPLLRPHMVLPPPSPTEPRMERWTSLMPRLETGGRDVFAYNDGFFAWWEMQVPVIEDFPYAGMDFRNDVSLALPEGAQWDASGILSPILNLFVTILKCFSNVFGIHGDLIEFFFM